MQSGQYLQHRGLAAAGWADQRDQLAFPDVHGDVGDGEEFRALGTIDLADVAQADEGLVGAHASHFCRFAFTKASSERSACSRQTRSISLHLAGAESFGGIEAPQSLHQSLPPQDFMAAGDAAVKIVGDIEERAVAVGDAGVERQQVGRQGVLAARGLAHLELLDRARGPHRPVPEQAALEIRARGDALVAQVERQHQVEQDVIVIAGIERDAVERAGRRHAAQHVERPVAVERRDLDGDDVVDRSEAAPEIGAEDDAADRRLQIEADQRDLARHRLAMRDDLVLGRRFHRGEAEQAGVVADAARGLRLGDGLRGRAGKPCDHRGWTFGP